MDGWTTLLIFALVGGVIGTFLQPIFTAFNAFFERLSQAYARLLDQAIRAAAWWWPAWWAGWC